MLTVIRMIGWLDDPDTVCELIFRRRLSVHGHAKAHICDGWGAKSLKTKHSLSENVTKPYWNWIVKNMYLKYKCLPQKETKISNRFAPILGYDNISNTHTRIRDGHGGVREWNLPWVSIYELKSQVTQWVHFVRTVNSNLTS